MRIHTTNYAFFNCFLCVDNFLFPQSFVEKIKKMKKYRKFVASGIFCAYSHPMISNIKGIFKANEQ